MTPWFFLTRWYAAVLQASECPKASQRRNLYIGERPQVPAKRRVPLLKMAHWLLASDRPLANARRSVNPLESGIMLPSRDREGVVADSFSDLSLLKMAHWLLARPHFHGSIVSRKLMNNCATKLLSRVRQKL